MFRDLGKKRKTASAGGYTCTCLRVVYNILEQMWRTLGWKHIWQMRVLKKPRERKEQKNLIKFEDKAHRMLEKIPDADKTCSQKRQCCQQVKQPCSSFPAQLLVGDCCSRRNVQHCEGVFGDCGQWSEIKLHSVRLTPQNKNKKLHVKCFNLSLNKNRMQTQKKRCNRREGNESSCTV